MSPKVETLFHHAAHTLYFRFYAVGYKTQSGEWDDFPLDAQSWTRLDAPLLLLLLLLLDDIPFILLKTI